MEPKKLRIPIEEAEKFSREYKKAIASAGLDRDKRNKAIEKLNIFMNRVRRAREFNSKMKRGKVTHKYIVIIPSITAIPEIRQLVFTYAMG